MRLLLFVMLLITLNSTAKVNLEEMYVYNTKIWDEVVEEDYKVDRIKIDSIDVDKIIFLLENANIKKHPFYKPTSNSVYGIVRVKDQWKNIRISPDVIFIDFEEQKHYFIEEKKNRDWLHSFIIKYSKRMKSSYSYPNSN